MQILATTPFGLISNYDYGVLPLFLLMGGLILNAGYGAALFRLAHALLGKLSGGLAVATHFRLRYIRRRQFIEYCLCIDHRPYRHPRNAQIPLQR